jgi:hypothetical protein
VCCLKRVVQRFHGALEGTCLPFARLAVMAATTYDVLQLTVWDGSYLPCFERRPVMTMRWHAPSGVGSCAAQLVRFPRMRQRPAANSRERPAPAISPHSTPHSTHRPARIFSANAPNGRTPQFSCVDSEPPLLRRRPTTARRVPGP